MAKQPTITTDLFLNFKAITCLTDAADSATLAEAKINTGLSIRGMIIWLIHLLEVHMPLAGATCTVRAALSTRQGLTSMPSQIDDGLICRWEQKQDIAAAGALVVVYPHAAHYLPPIPIATPEISLYVDASPDIAGMRAKPVDVRLGMTTSPLDAAAYTEIAETWGW